MRVRAQTRVPWREHRSGTREEVGVEVVRVVDGRGLVVPHHKGGEGAAASRLAGLEGGGEGEGEVRVRVRVRVRARVRVRVR